MRILIDQERCIGSGMCLGITPDVFSLNDKGKAVAVATDGAMRTAVESAVVCCPVEAISVEE